MITRLYVELLTWLQQERAEEGQDLVEYAMLVALIAIVCVVGVKAFGGSVNTYFSSIAGKIPLT
jgi:pilus assembly protein Flp/PilA